MKTIKVSEAQGQALNWLVAKCEGLNPNTTYDKPMEYGLFPGWREGDGFGYPIKAYGLNWGYGGPIIERERIGTLPKDIHRGSLCTAFVYERSQHDLCIEDGMNYIAFGPTPLVAAMRCYVASKLGDEIDVPKELL